ncbi:MAG: Cna B-type domain-containing protein, partial [Oscillospiraceae bacterium]|nr:Cna B-type domain-containing protein [Oscillospiraceae bacterium]
ADTPAEAPEAPADTPADDAAPEPETEPAPDTEPEQPPETAMAAKAPVRPLASGTPTMVDVTITSFELQNLSNHTVTTIYWSDSFYLAMDWDASANGANLHEGDYFDITLPGNMMFPAGTTATDFTLTDGTGTVIATAHVTPGPGDVGGTVHVTFTDTVEDRYNVKGTMYLAARFDREQVTTGEANTFVVTVNGEVGGSSHSIDTGVIVTGPKELENEYLAKWGQSVYNQPNLAEWWVRINHTKATLTNVVISDTLGTSGEHFLPETFLLRQVEFDSYGHVLTSVIVDTSDLLTFSEDQTSFTLNLGDLNGEQYQLTYRSTYTPGSTLKNAVNLSSTEYKDTFPATHISAESGGTGGGDLASKIRLIKVDAEDESVTLAGAVFRVTAPDGSSFELTTGADGTVTSSSLTQGTYTVTEISAPAGYLLSSETYTLEVTSTGGAIQTISDQPVTIDIPVSKTWIGPAADHATIHLLADGEDTGLTLTLSSDNQWAGSFDGLRQYDTAGNEIHYSVSEDAIEHYASAISGSAGEGYTVTNQNVETIDLSGSKTWDDADDQDGARPDSITIRLLANGTEVERRTVTAADSWAWRFEGLPKYEDGVEITYAITEDAVPDYTTAYDGYDVTNTHAPGKTSLSVTKAWDDQNDQDGIRPQSVTIHLLADGVDTGMTLELSEANRWTGVFSDLDEYKNGVKIVYTVAEPAVDGYTTAISGDAETGFTVTNSHTPTPPKDPPKTPRAPKTGDTTHVFPYILGAVASLCVLILLCIRSRRTRRREQDEMK